MINECQVDGEHRLSVQMLPFKVYLILDSLSIAMVPFRNMADSLFDK